MFGVVPMKNPRIPAFALASWSLVAVAQAPVPQILPSTPIKLHYQSAFADYRSYADLDSIAWKRANDDAAAVGGPMGQMARDVGPSAITRPGAVPVARIPPAPPAMKHAPHGATGHPK